VLVMAIYLRTQRLAALIIAHWTMDLTAAFRLIERARTKTRLPSRNILREGNLLLTLFDVFTEPGCTWPLAPPS
jgi:hypothetical protein